VIRVAHLHKAYGTTIAVEDVSFTVHAGEIFGILGRNGAGKTTTVECISGLRTADRGEISVLGLDPRRDRRELHERVGVQLQHSALPERRKVGEAVKLYASFYRQPADGRELLATLGLDAVQDFRTRIVGHSHGKPLRETSYLPEPVVALPFAHYSTVTFILSTGTEARALTANLTAEFVAGIFKRKGYPPLGACYVKHWLVSMRVSPY
jgi:ABC-type Fe3+/spermidine/putrescine transport system ATPase subunit